MAAAKDTSFECCHQLYAAVGKAEVVHQRMTDISDADQNGTKPAVHPENTGNLCPQRRNIVAVTLLAEFAETAEILPDLRRRQAKLLAEFKRRNPVDAARFKLIQLSQVARQPANDVV